VPGGLRSGTGTSGVACSAKQGEGYVAASIRRQFDRTRGCVPASHTPLLAQALLYVDYEGDHSARVEVPVEPSIPL